MQASQPGGSISRRRLVQGAIATSAVSGFSRKGRAQSLRPVKFTLPWIIGGSNYWPVVGKQLGYYSKRGLDINVARGFGSNAAAIAIANKQFDFGIVFAGPVLLAASRGLPLVALGTIYYDATMGLVVLADSPIRQPKDLEGRRMGVVPADAVAPFFPAFAVAAGVDRSKVTLVQTDPKIEERTLADKQVDAITAVGNANIPVLVAMGVKTRFISWQPYGIKFYAAQLVTRRDMIQQDPKLCQAVADATFESVAYSLRHPDESIDLLAKAVPEIGLTAGGRENARLAQALTQIPMIAPEAQQHGLGWSDDSKYPAMIDLIMKYLAPPDAKRPDVNSVVSNEFAGNIKLSAADWATAKAYTAPFAKYLS